MWSWCVRPVMLPLPTALPLTLLARPPARTVGHRHACCAAPHAQASWWGPSGRERSSDTQGVSTDSALPALLAAAAAEGSAVALHLEPYPGRSAHSVREDLRYLVDTYGSSPGLLRIEGRLVHYVYDSYHIAPADWAELLAPGGEHSVRGTDLDGAPEVDDCTAPGRHGGGLVSAAGDLESPQEATALVARSANPALPFVADARRRLHWSVAGPGRWGPSHPARRV